MPSEQRREWIEWQQPALSITRQCALVGVPRSTVYYEPVAVSAADLELMRRLDEQYTRTPFYGSRRMTAWLRTQGHLVNRKRVTRLLALLGLEALVPRRRLSTPAPGHRIYPYLLRGVSIDRVDQVWSTDITYIRLRRGFAYLVAVLDWYSRSCWRPAGSATTRSFAPPSCRSRCLSIRSPATPIRATASPSASGSARAWSPTKAAAAACGRRSR